jgi:hypothetical protein
MLIGAGEFADTMWRDQGSGKRIFPAFFTAPVSVSS